jgi:hypothetical protein
VLAAAPVNRKHHVARLLVDIDDNVDESKSAAIVGEPAWDVQGMPPMGIWDSRPVLDTAEMPSFCGGQEHAVHERGRRIAVERVKAEDHQSVRYPGSDHVSSLRL